MNNTQSPGTRLRRIANDLCDAIPDEGCRPDWDRIAPLLHLLFELAYEIEQEEQHR